MNKNTVKKIILTIVILSVLILSLMFFYRITSENRGDNVSIVKRIINEKYEDVVYFDNGYLYTYNQKKEHEYIERGVHIGRITKVVKGGRRFRFSALVIIGDGKGKIGFGTGKAAEVPDAIKKATESAKKNLFEVSKLGTTIPHEVIGEYGAGKIVLKPASEGTGVIAGGPVRAVLEVAGISNILSKSLGSNTPINMVRATVAGLKQLRTAEEVAATRGIDIARLG